MGGPILLKSDDSHELASEHRRLGYAAAYCPSADVKDVARCKAIVDPFQAENVIIAEVGAWKNMLDPDTAKRKESIDYVTTRLALAEVVGARCCADIAGSFNPTVWYGPHKDNFSKAYFDATVENCRKVIDAVKPARTKFTLEILGWCTPETADRYLQLIQAIQRPGFAAHIDVCNAVNSPEKFYNNAAVTNELFTKLGRWIVSCHAKDLAWTPEMNVHFVEVIPGCGELDYKPYLNCLTSIDAPLMLEHLRSANEYLEAATYVRRVAGQIGVTFL
ncbi:MAG: sugar phosphate isomerase/epimerase [Acidobacteria bacterium]|nr:sugar phosphate isomerase/epimerase [Acidobacteriota bacterium]